MRKEEAARKKKPPVKDPPNIRLAIAPGAQNDNNLAGANGVERIPAALAPSILVSFFYYKKGFAQRKHEYIYRDWVMDSGAFSAENSGAFSAENSGVKIDLKEYIEVSLELMATDPLLAEIFALDVIGNPRSSRANCEKMWEAGIPAIPTFHVGSKEAELKSLAKEYPKIALGGAVGFKKKLEWAAQCFARVWPCRIHGFGFGAEKQLMALPWHSVDATSWVTGPCKFGRWASFGGPMPIRGSNQNLRSEIEHYLKIERKARARWKREMALLSAQDSPKLRLAMNSNLWPAYIECLKRPAESPAVRLAVQASDLTNGRKALAKKGDEK